MNKYLSLGIGFAAVLSLSACDDDAIFSTETGGTGTGGTGGGVDCMEEVDEDGTPLVLPPFREPISDVPDAVFEDCMEYTGAVEIAYVPPVTCSGGTWGVEMEHRGPSSAARFIVHDSAGGSDNEDIWWGEEHPMPDGTSGLNGWYETYSLSLDAGASLPITPGTNSLLTCDKNDNATLVFGMEVFDAEDDTNRVDCVVFSPSETTDDFVDHFNTAFPHMSNCDLIEGWLH